MVELRGIEKFFPSNGVTALERGDFDLRPGEIHALLGENGAGKSTLMHIMAGHLRPGAGQILLDGRELHLSSPADGLEAGIGMVRQYPRLIPGFTVWEDCILGAEPHTGPFLNRRAARALVLDLSRRWGFDLPVDSGAGSLTVSQRQKSAILALLLRKAQYLIFDEPAAVLTPRETDLFFRLLRRLKAEGKGIVLISHKLEETMALADRVTVLKKGRTAAVRTAASLSGYELGKLMFGASPAGSGPAVSVQGPPAAGFGAEGRVFQENKSGAGEEACLIMENISVDVPGRPLIRNSSLTLKKGTILGIAGVRDSGLETLELVLTGFLKPSKGRIILNGQDIGGRGHRAFRSAGAACLSAGGTVAARLPLEDSVILHAHRRALVSGGGLSGLFRRLGIMDRSFLNAWTAGVLNRAGINAAPRVRGDSLSGGMQQRAALARELAEQAAVLVLSEPGRGLDRKSRDRLAEELRAAAKSGGIIIFSTDVDELIALSDEILVLRNGLFSDHILMKPAETSVPGEGVRERIGRAMVGGGR
ncbi:MAG: ATP-binding cassette domain-containing protein [Treponema sp.]|nr:ATP-binding cassette domain-containing protein [Treponema sp.]